MFIDETLYKFLVGDSRARTAKSIAAVIHTKFPTAGDAFVDDMAQSVVDYLDRCRANRQSKKLTAPCYWRKVTYWSDDPMDGGRMVAYVRGTALDIITKGESWLFEVAGAQPAYSGGPGRQFVHAPSYSLQMGRIRVTQSFGYDI